MVKSTDTYTYKVDGEDKEIFMSYGLLNKLSQMIGGNQNLDNLLLDMNLQLKVLQEVLGNDMDKMTRAQVTPVLGWVAEHVVDFMISSCEEFQEVNEKFKDRMEALNKLAETASPSTPSGSAA